MAAFIPFQANKGGTVSVAAVSTSTSGSVTISASVIGMSPSMLVASNSSVMLFVRIDNTTVTLATSIDIPIPPNATLLLANPYPVGPAVVSVSGSVFGAGSGTVFFTPGEGGAGE